MSQWLFPPCAGGLGRPRPTSTLASAVTDFVHILAIPQTCIPTLEFSKSQGKLSKPLQKQNVVYICDLRILFVCLLFHDMPTRAKSGQQQHVIVVKGEHKTELHRTGNDCYITMSAENFMLFRAHCLAPTQCSDVTVAMNSCANRDTCWCELGTAANCTCFKWIEAETQKTKFGCPFLFFLSWLPNSILTFFRHHL